jgi:hypothetical protein
VRGGEQARKLRQGQHARRTQASKQERWVNAEAIATSQSSHARIAGPTCAGGCGMAMKGRMVARTL